MPSRRATACRKPAPYSYVPARSRSRRRAVTPLVGMLSCSLIGVAYLAAAWQVAFGLHIGHVVQDGIDTGDMLALPLVLMATLSFFLATACFDVLEKRLALVRAR